MHALSDSVPGCRDWLAHGGSLSKVLSPGLRVGWMIAPPPLLANATICKQFADAHSLRHRLSQCMSTGFITADAF